MKEAAQSIRKKNVFACLNDGIILVDKPSGLTSQRVVQIVKRKLGAKKVGHAGTLDPLATGLLVILINKATKLSNNFLNCDKVYEVEAQLFIETDTNDVTGKIIRQQKPFAFELNKIFLAINQFNDFSYWQKPPIYSAIKVKGKKLYQYARRNIQIEVPLRLVKIRKIELLGYSTENHKFKFLVECSKGTYVRSLVRDIAEKLGVFAAVSRLRRIKSGQFYLSQSLNLDEVDEEKIISFL